MLFLYIIILVKQHLEPVIGMFYKMLLCCYNRDLTCTNIFIDGENNAKIAGILNE